MHQFHESLPLDRTEDRISEARQVRALMKILPLSLQERALSEKSWEDYPTVAPLKEWVLRKVRDTQHLRTSGNPFKVALVDPTEDDDDEDTKKEVQELSEAASAEEVLALDRKRFARRNQKKKGAGK